MRIVTHGATDVKRRTLPNFRFMSHPLFILFPMDLTRIKYEEYIKMYNYYKTKAFQNKLASIILNG